MQDGRSRAQDRLRGTSAAKDAAKRSAKGRLADLAGAVGNEAMTDRIAQGNANRDQMLAFIADRLGGIRQLQLREVALTRRGANWDWWRQAADAHRPDHPEPEPTHWRLSAQKYSDAMGALCRGDLARGSALLDDAISEEQRVRDSLTDIVDTTDLDEVADASFLEGLARATPACGACDEPAAIQTLVDAIERVEQTVPDMPNRRRRRDPWWTLDEDEEEQEEDPG